MAWAMMSALLLCLAGCNVGGGDGWAKGRLWVENCTDGNPFGESPHKPDDFDLRADFYAGEPMEDSNASIEQRRNALNIRIQDTSTNLEASNGLFFQFLNLTAAAHSLAQSALLPVSSKELCCEKDCTNPLDVLRVSLYLFAVCPNCKQPMVGSNCIQAADKNDQQCLLASGKEIPAPCPALTAAQQHQLNTICLGDFNDSSVAGRIRQIMGSGSCLYLCQFGAAQRGQPLEQLKGFRIDYEQHVAGLFSISIKDGRALKLRTCAKTLGDIQGMFSFEVKRGRAGQSFP